MPLVVEKLNGSVEASVYFLSCPVIFKVSFLPEPSLGVAVNVAEPFFSILKFPPLSIGQIDESLDLYVK